MSAPIGAPPYSTRRIDGVGPGSFSNALISRGSMVAIAMKPLTFSARIRLSMPSVSKLVITTGRPRSR